MIIVWQKPDSNLAVTTIIDGSNPKEHAKDLQDRGDIPSDWVAVGFGPDIQFPAEAQETWVWDGKQIVTDLEKFREHTKDRLRLERAPLMADLDIRFQRALEDAADTTAIVTEKRRLRDITKFADAATSIGELKALKA